MGCQHAKLTAEERAAIDKSKELDKELTDQGKRDNRIIKVLLLGTGESGKSTILKQMRILYDEKGFTSIEKETFKVVVRRNVVESMQTLLEGVEDWKYEFDSKESQAAAQFINDIDGHSIDMWSAEIVSNIKQLWPHESAIQKSFDNRNKLQLLDSTPYLFENVERIGEKDYLPIPDDILRARLRTTGIVEEDVVINDVPFQFLDVGGQRNERRKWIHCFGDVKALIFVAALSEYDQVLYEDDEQNRLHEALDVYQSIVNNPAFVTTSMVLFLNKIDLFEDKLKVVNFKESFPKFEGDHLDVKDTAEHIQELFFERCEVDGKDLFAHLTCATDTGNVQRVFEVCKLRILQDNLACVGLR